MQMGLTALGLGGPGSHLRGLELSFQHNMLMLHIGDYPAVFMTAWCKCSQHDSTHIPHVKPSRMYRVPRRSWCHDERNNVHAMIRALSFTPQCTVALTDKDSLQWRVKVLTNTNWILGTIGISPRSSNPARICTLSCSLDSA